MIKLGNNILGVGNHVFNFLNTDSKEHHHIHNFEISHQWTLNKS
jgi:hypothetical protein